MNCKQILSSFLMLVSFNTIVAQIPEKLFYRAEIDKHVYDLYDNTGKKIFDTPVYWVFKNFIGWLHVKHDSTEVWSYYDSDIKPVIIEGATDIRTAFMYTNRVAVLSDKGWGYYDPKGVLRIPHQYDEVSKFYKGKALVERDTDRFFIDTNGARLQGRCDTFNRNYILGNVMTANAGEFWVSSNDDYTVIVKKKKKGLSDKNGNVIIPAIYTELYDLQKKYGLVIVEIDGKFGLLNLKREVIIPIQYKDINSLN